ncbi:AAA family ATPase [Vibrio sp. nBUS_14]|uniref:AAA family ATPase n=1 Tax=Vibrio sp. nBUS_14 TaxID=3395321 RepID=UPI003EBB99D2
MRINEFVEQCSSLESSMSLSYEEVAPSFKFSNTGARGTKYFSITLKQAIQALKDIRDNLTSFEPYTHYVERDWRDLFPSYLTDDVSIAMSTVQTLPLFTVLSKIITVANNLEESYIEKVIPLSQHNLETSISYLESQLPDNNAYLAAMGTNTLEESDRVKTGVNKIYYGAPGTGKSYRIDNETNDAHTIRTVFHPDTQYSDFIGSLKPAMINGDISYDFRPGSFTNAIIHAVKNPSEECTLIIEEINRAAAAAAFGEIFQLLDRTVTKESKYPIDISDPDWFNYLNNQTDNFFSNGKLYIPSNLTLLATMNSSDQAVMPLDTAFKRRWLFEYLPLDYDNAANGTLPLPLETPTGDVVIKLVKWRDFAKTINEALAEDHIPEDKLLGHRFLDDSELNENGANALKGKLFMYLWDDVLRHGQRGAVFAEYIADDQGEVELTTYGQLIKAYDAENNVLRDSISDKLYRLTIANEEQA